MSNKSIQLRKGIFEMIILQLLKKNSYYGYSLIKEISINSSFEINEGTIYPILSRISKENLISSEWRESSSGPPRKYYKITESGLVVLKELEAEYNRLAKVVSKTKNIGKTKKNISKKKIYPGKENKNER